MNEQDVESPALTYRRVARAVHLILLNDWDPIGVRDEPNAQDEYDGYLGEIVRLLMHKASDNDLISYLDWVVHSRMGMDRTPAGDECTLKTVRLLLGIDLLGKSRRY